MNIEIVSIVKQSSSRFYFHSKKRKDFSMNVFFLILFYLNFVELLEFILGDGFSKL